MVQSAEDQLQQLLREERNMTTEDHKKIAKIESLAKEAIRCAIGEIRREIRSERALEAFKEFQLAVSEPSLIIDLIREWRATELETS